MEEMINVVQNLMMEDAALEDYVDAEGLLCCGKCHTRKQMINEKPIIVGNRIFDRYPIMCQCRREQYKKDEAERKMREHLTQVDRLKSVCFTSSEMRNACLEKADLTKMEHLDLIRFYIDKWTEMKKTNTGFLLWGDSGNGKTYTAACIANALMGKEVSVLMRNMSYFLNAGFGDREEYLRDVQRYGLLIIDDLGMERGTGYGLEMVFSIINARYESGKPTIITTNLSLNSLQNPEDLVHKRIYDRVLEMCVPVQFRGKSLRGALARKKT
jgi:DNA replication protein DnaC